MMLKRLRLFEFSHVLTSPVKVPPCGRCFAYMLLRWGAGQRAAFKQKRGTGPPTGETPEAKRNCSAWSTDGVAEYLARLELGHLEAKFRENGVDGQMLVCLSDEDLVTELGLSKLQARKVRQRLPV